MNLKPLFPILALTISLMLMLPAGGNAQEFDHQKDIVYGYKDGMALVMDIFAPCNNKNGAGIIRVMAGGMSSSPVASHRAAGDSVVRGLLQAGYIVFAMAHSSQPKYTADEIRRDIPRGVRFIRHHAESFGLDPQRIGIMGSSSGGQISLMAALAPPDPDPGSKDPVEHESSRVQAVIAYFPGTDLLNFGKENTTILEHFHTRNYRPDAAFDFHEWDTASKRYERVTDPDALHEYYRRNSPLSHVSDDDPPVFLIHGDNDQLVPIQQSYLMVDKLTEAGVPNRLIVMEGQGHGWRTPRENEVSEILAWLDQHLR
jgi:acetyl esterase/lipase